MKKVRKKKKMNGKENCELTRRYCGVAKQEQDFLCSVWGGGGPNIFSW